ncbi:winged helix-turn-helix domain-containing protein [Actinomadura madurae]|uniref:GntR family transcriptional regulator n=1 Tax=Actinomadura madurae TaxID=1993 RepID=UPI00399A85AF
MGKPGSADRRKVYVRIADELRKDIVAGRYPVGEALPSIAKLGERFGAAGATVERALAVLREENIIMSRQGTPSVVTRRPEQKAPGEPSGEAAEGPSEEFTLLLGQLQEIREHVRRLSAKVDDLDERTRDL